ADGLASGATELVRGLGALAILGIAGWLVLRWPTGSRVEALRAGSFLMLATVLLSPVVHHWYALWCVPLLAACPLGRRGVTALVAASLLLGLVAPLDSSLHGAPVAIVVTTVLVAGVAAPLLGLLRGLIPWPEPSAGVDEDRVGERDHASAG
ncbi:MAG: polyprenol phosphomannose-dependent alpha 1,6 mannosyltransferase MptB, partial [Nocardioidaceae bacterium]